ncbi:MAG: GNAT family N-acetyltransferase [Vulcanibacillus sp.]
MKNKNEVIIRKINKIDLEKNKIRIVNLLIDNYKINFPDRPYQKKLSLTNYNEMNYYLQNKSALIFAAFDEKNLIGFLWAYKKKLLGETRVHVDHIIIENKSRGKGIGGELMRSIEEYSKKMKIGKIELMTSVENKKSINFYKSKGYSTERVLMTKEILKK